MPIQMKVRRASGGTVWVNEPACPRSFRVDGAVLLVYREGAEQSPDVVYTAPHFDQDPLNIASALYTALALDSEGSLVKKNGLFTPEELEDLAPLACIHHLDHRTITSVVEGGSGSMTTHMQDGEGGFALSEPGPLPEGDYDEGCGVLQVAQPVTVRPGPVDCEDCDALEKLIVEEKVNL